MPRCGRKKNVPVFDSGPGPLRELWHWSYSDAERAVESGEAEWGQYFEWTGAFVPLASEETAPNALHIKAIRLLGDEPLSAMVVRSAELRNGRFTPGLLIRIAEQVVESALRDAASGGTSWSHSCERTPAPAH